MKGKVCLVTGGSAGIGKMSALQLAKMGATVVIVSRDLERGEAALAEIKAKSGNPNVQWMQADLSSQADIRRLTAEFKQKYDQLHLLINNAGMVALERQLSVDGLEMTFAVNHLSYFLLTNLLLDVLVASQPARIVNVASQAHSQQIDFDNLQSEQSFQGITPYFQSKLANIMFTVALSRQLEGINVTVNCLHPGVINTDLLANYHSASHPNGVKKRGLLSSLKQMIRPAGAPPAEGAQAVLYLALSPEVAGVSGKYFANNQVAKLPVSAEDGVALQRLWDVSAELTHWQDSSLGEQ